MPEFLLYDSYVRLTPEIQTPSSNILLVEADLDRKNAGDEIWLELLRILEKMRPKQILFTFLPEHVSEGFCRAAEDYANVLFGRDIIETRGEYTFEPLPKAYERHRLPFGVVSIPQSYHGIHRYQSAYVDINGQRYLSLESAAVQSVHPEQQLSESSPYLVNFNGKYGGMPKIPFDRVFSGDIITDLVQGKYIIIGLKKTALVPGLQTPLTPFEGMSPVEFHGYALNTLLSDQAITVIDDRVKLLLIAATGLVVFVLSRLLNTRLFLWTLVPMSAIYAGFSWLVFSYFSIWTPLVELLTAHLLTALVILGRTIIQHEHTARKMLTKTSAKLRERTLPESLYTTQDPWVQIINMVNQLLDLHRAIFLEAVESDHRVREIKAFNCSFSDIHERRRDYHQPPYSRAVQENSCLKLQDHIFLTDTNIHEEQYLIPLVFGGRVLGFWVFGIDASKRAEISNFKSVLSDLAVQIGELLHKMGQKRSQDISEEKGMRKFLQLGRIDDAHQRLHNSIALLERHLNLLETVLDGANTAVIFYDLFGRVLHVNRRMSDLMNASDFHPYTMTAADFTSGITNLPPDELRHSLRCLLFERKSLTLPALLPSEPKKQYMLHLRPLIREKSEISQDEVYPFQSYGILFELLEVTELKIFNQLKDELFDNLNYRFRRDFEPVVLACSLLEENELPEAKRTAVFQILYKRIDRLLTCIHQAKSDLLRDGLPGTVEHYPIDPRQPLYSAVDEFASLIEGRKILFELELPESIRMVRADPDGLVESIRAILAILINDAVEDSVIRIDLIEMDQEIVYSFSNTGFGMPNHVFQKYIFDNAEATSPEFKKLRDAVARVREWGGSIGALSNVGDGIQFTMHLKSIL